MVDASGPTSGEPEMARTLCRLTALQVRNAPPGRHADGAGLYLVVRPEGGRKWVFRFTLAGRTRDLGLGSAATVTLADAREAAEKARRMAAAGEDPIAARRTALVPAAPAATFGDVAGDLLKTLEPSFRNKKHGEQWKMTLEVYAAPLRSKPVDSISTDDVLSVLNPLWLKVPETASRLRQRIERVLDVAKVRGLRSAENPARWRGHLELLLPKRAKGSRGHHAALPVDQVPVVVAGLRATGGVSALALEFTILVACRTGETIGARWSEIDLAAKVWSIPAGRMKAGVPHRIPLGKRAVQILTAMLALKSADDGFVFPGAKKNRPLSQMALAMALRRQGFEHVTVHGFRSTFRDWAGDRTQYPREVIEQALAHLVGSATELAYRRSDALEKRRKLMDEWAQHCEPKAPGVVTPLKRAG